LNWDKQLNENWSIGGTIGHNYNQSTLRSEETTGNELQQAGVFNLSNVFHLSLEEAVFQKKIAGVFADLHWAYRKRLFLNLSGRHDWSSTLPQRNNAFFYPGIHLGWDMTSLLKIVPALSYSKLRLSYSSTGNDASTYLTDTYFNPAIIDGDDLLPGLSFPAFGITAFERSTTLGNNNLRPERAHNFEVGTELKWWDNRLSIDLSWYKAIVQDQIINAQLSAASGFLRSPINAGTIENSGWELQLKTNWIRKKDWYWETLINFTQFESIVTALAPGVPNIILGSYTSLSSMIIEGQPYGVLVGTSVKRSETGERVIDEDGFPLLNDQQTIIGDPNPDWLMSIQNVWRYKGFSINMLWDIRKGGDIWNGTRGVLSYLGLSEESGLLRDATNIVFEGVTQTGEPNTKTVSLADPEAGMSGIYWRRYGFLGLAEDHIEDASWLRLRELSFSYHFTLPWQHQRSPQMLLALQAHNLLLFTPYSGIDPETNLRGDSNIIGWDYFNMPGVKGYSLRLQVDF
ncbi:MAG: TonB-dependent receptor, partial [Bacteroidota bacterium]